jgi:hypothetical protein
MLSYVERWHCFDNRIATRLIAGVSSLETRQKLLAKQDVIACCRSEEAASAYHNGSVEPNDVIIIKLICFRNRNVNIMVLFFWCISCYQLGDFALAAAILQYCFDFTF